MAVCLTLTAGALYSGTTTTTIRIASGSSAISQVPYSVSTALVTGDTYSCTTGAYLLVTPAEFNAAKTYSPFVATPDHYIAVTAVFASALTAMAVIWGVRKVLQLFNNHPEA